jgi:hypothetical protein
MCRFKSNDFVECIDDRPLNKQITTMPQLGRLYTVASIRAVTGGWSVRLNELTPDCYRGGPCRCGHCGWDSTRFRKVYRPRDANLADLRALLEVPLEIEDEVPAEWVAALRSGTKE